MKKLNLTHSITLSAMLILGLLATVSPAESRSPGDRAIFAYKGHVGSDPVVDMPVEFKPNDNRPGLLDQRRAQRAARRQAQQALRDECLERRIARSLALGITSIFWSEDNLPPACRRFTGAE